jgi:hypothetical protein
MIDQVTRQEKTEIDGTNESGWEKYIRLSVDRINEYIVALPHSVPKSKEPGHRGGLCGFAASEGIEAVKQVNREGAHFAAVAIQAETLNKAIPPNIDLYLPFRRHGFNLVVDRDQGKWLLLDLTFNQFVEKDKDGNLKMNGSLLPISGQKRGFGQTLSETARSLLENGWVELNLDTLIAYFALMSTRRINRDIIDILRTGLSETWNLQNTLMEMTNSCLINEKSKTGYWESTLLPDKVERFYEKN